MPILIVITLIIMQKDISYGKHAIIRAWFIKKPKNIFKWAVYVRESFKTFI